MTRLAILVALSLTACATKPLPRVETVEVRVVVPVPCLNAADIPARPVAPKLPDDMQAALAVSVGLLLEWFEYGVVADGQLRACAKVR